MNEMEYNKAPGIRRSDLWIIHDSPEKFRYKMDNPEEPTPALVFGQAAHKMLLEPTEFYEEFAVKPEGIDRRTKEGKEEYARFLRQAEGKTVIDLDTYATIRGMVDKAIGNPQVRKLLSGRKEIPFFWTDPDTGVACKVKCDCVTYLDDMPVIVDYKTCKSAKTEDFIRDAYKYGYHLQVAMYTEGMMQVKHLKERPMFVFIVEEKDPPFALNLVTVPDDVMDYGLDTMRELLGIYKECEEMDNWFGYNGPFNQQNEMSLPGWLAKEIENEN